jgi:coenzyme F420-reducing hydrogenase gamma subunit
MFLSNTISQGEKPTARNRKLQSEGKNQKIERSVMIDLDTSNNSSPRNFAIIEEENTCENCGAPCPENQIRCDKCFEEVRYRHQDGVGAKVTSNEK